MLFYYIMMIMNIYLLNICFGKLLDLYVCIYLYIFILYVGYKELDNIKGKNWYFCVIINYVFIFIVNLNFMNILIIFL